MANKFFPKKKGGRITAIVLLLLALGIAAVLWHYHGVPPWAPHWLRFEHKTVAVSAAVPQQRKALPVIAPAAPTVSADKDCVEQQLKLLGSARADAVEKAKRLYARKAGGNEFVAYVASNLDGDPGKGPNGLLTLGKYIEWNFTAKNGAKFHLDDVRQVCICHHWHYAYTAAPTSRKLSSKIISLPLGKEKCIEYDFDARKGDEVRWAAITKDRMPSGCWKLCDGDECSAPPSPCTTCDWLGPLSVIPGNRIPEYTGLYVVRHGGRQRFFAPAQMRNEYFALCIDREGYAGDSDSWIARPEEWGGRSPYTTSLNRIYLVPASQWPVWGVYDSKH